MAKYKQVGMWGAGEDLPLFSGAAVRVADAGPVAEAAGAEKQLSWATCPVCQDTGTVKVGRADVACTCPTGRAVMMRRYGSGYATTGDGRRIPADAVCAMCKDTGTVTVFGQSLACACEVGQASAGPASLSAAAAAREAADAAGLAPHLAGDAGAVARAAAVAERLAVAGRERDAWEKACQAWMGATAAWDQIGTPYGQDRMEAAMAALEACCECVPPRSQ